VVPFSVIKWFPFHLTNTVSRYPQIVSLSIIFLGKCLAIGSWAAMFMLRMSKLLQHFGILAEEEVCLKQYGEPYRAFMARAPRHLLFF
jgi:protein-S-isoprenylcysteine O-methyltransferase Ste14